MIAFGSGFPRSADMLWGYLTGSFELRSANNNYSEPGESGFRKGVVSFDIIRCLRFIHFQLFAGVLPQINDCQRYPNHCVLQRCDMCCYHDLLLC